MKSIDLQYLHLIKGMDMNIVYNSSTIDLVVVNNRTCDVLDLLKKGIGIQEVETMLKISQDKILEIINSLTKISDNNDKKQCLSPQSRVVERITLHVSNDCNLRCKYCYAGGGNYKQKRGIMSLQTAKQFVDFCFQNFDAIGTIVFFGGEPLLNMEVMEYVCDAFRRNYEERRIAFMPEFGIITNGTILTDRVFNFIKNNLAFVTVSIDGLKEFNDANRVFINGKGSYKKISKFIHELTEKTKVKIRYEATYTQYHIDRGCKQS